MRSILYILFAVGGVLVAIALSMVLLDNESEQQVQPQSPSIELSKPAADKAETSDTGTSDTDIVGQVGDDADSGHSPDDTDTQ